MVQFVHDGTSHDGAGQVFRAPAWRLLVERKMRAHMVVVVGIGLENTAQVRLAEDDDVVETFASDRSDCALDVRILPE